MKNANRFIRRLSLISSITFMVGMINSLLTTDTTSRLASGIIGIIFSIMPLLSFYKKLNPPLTLTLFIYLFNLSSILLGTLIGFYDRFFWWDMYLHFASGVLFAWIGFFLFDRLNKKNDQPCQINRLIIYLFGFSLPLSIGVLWEIFEFASDQLFNTNLQRSGLMDTMTDLIMATLGSILTTIVFIMIDQNKKKSCD